MSRGPIVLAGGDGDTVTDVDGNRYVDLAAGFGAVLLGHDHPRLRAALNVQGQRLVQGLGDIYASDTKVLLLEALSSLHPCGHAQVILGQSGSDAITAAIKTATLATGRHAFVAFDGAYHGLGYAPLPACGYSADFHRPFDPQLNPSVHHAPYPGLRHASADASLSFVEDLLSEHEVAAVLVEPILGRGGCVVPPPGYLMELCDLAHAHDALVIADEVWTGMGRTGSWLRSQVEGAAIDVVCLGKGLGGGLPISACMAPPSIMQSWTRHGEVVHTSTHSGAPLACAAALAVIETLREEDLLTRARTVGLRALEAWRTSLDGSAHVIEVRGAGLMLAVELDDASTAQAAMTDLLGHGYLTLGGGIRGEVITFTPALTIDEEMLIGIGGVLRQTLSTS